MTDNTQTAVDPTDPLDPAADPGNEPNPISNDPEPENVELIDPPAPTPAAPISLATLNAAARQTEAAINDPIAHAVAAVEKALREALQGVPATTPKATM